MLCRADALLDLIDTYVEDRGSGRRPAGPPGLRVAERVVRATGAYAYRGRSVVAMVQSPMVTSSPYTNSLRVA